MIAVKEIREQFDSAEEAALPSLIGRYREDSRAGVQSLCARAEKKLAALAAERARVAGMRAYELEAARGYLSCGFLCGVDEAGRGPLAGPVAAGAVILPEEHELLYLNDSKKLTAAKREALYEQITKEAVSWAVGLCGPERIDEINILQATYEAMRSAVSQLVPAPEVLVNDAVRIPGIRLPQVPVVKGDAKCLSVAAASILAKVTRDRIMEEYDRQYPEYGFAGNKGYGSEAHIAALRAYGPCPIHRRSFIHSFTAEDPRGGRKAAGGSDSMRAIGVRQEEHAARYLRERGLVILERGFRSRKGEIDLIAGEPDGTLVFAEVKYRSSGRFGTGEAAVNDAKQKRIAEVSDYYRLIHSLPESTPCRFDVISVTDGDLCWIRNAFPYRK